MEKTSRTTPIVLVADDEPSMLALVSRHVETLGYDVLEASDGEAAWQQAAESLPDLVVLDVMMPGMSGWEVCRRIREHVALAHTGVIMLTGIGQSLNELTSPLYGADAYIDKPFEFKDLDEKIQRVLKGRGHEPIAVEPPPPPSIEAPEPTEGFHASHMEASDHSAAEWDKDDLGFVSEKSRISEPEPDLMGDHPTPPPPAPPHSAVRVGARLNGPDLAPLEALTGRRHSRGQDDEDEDSMAITLRPPPLQNGEQLAFAPLPSFADVEHSALDATVPGRRIPPPTPEDGPPTRRPPPTDEAVTPIPPRPGKLPVKKAPPPAKTAEPAKKPQPAKKVAKAKPEKTPAKKLAKPAKKPVKKAGPKTVKPKKTVKATKKIVKKGAKPKKTVKATKKIVKKAAKPKKTVKATKKITKKGAKPKKTVKATKKIVKKAAKPKKTVKKIAKKAAKPTKKAVNKAPTRTKKVEKVAKQAKKPNRKAPKSAAPKKKMPVKRPAKGSARAASVRLSNSSKAPLKR